MKKQLLSLLACSMLLQSTGAGAMNYLQRGREYVSQSRPVQYAQKQWEAFRGSSVQKLKDLADWMSSLSHGLRNAKNIQDVRDVLSSHKTGILAATIIAIVATYLGVRTVAIRKQAGEREKKYQQLEQEVLEAPALQETDFTMEPAERGMALRKEPVSGRPILKDEPRISLASRQQLYDEPIAVRRHRKLPAFPAAVSRTEEALGMRTPEKEESESPVSIKRTLQEQLHSLGTYSGESLWNEIALIIQDAQKINDQEIEEKALNMVLDDINIDKGPLSRVIAKAFLLNDGSLVSFTATGKTRGVKQKNWETLIQLAPSEKVIEEVKSKLHFQ